jgi:hypothetical protein
MRPNLDEQWLRRIWKYTVLPYIEEQFFDDHALLAAFEIDALLGDSSAGVDELVKVDELLDADELVDAEEGLDDDNSDADGVEAADGLT